MKPEAKVNGVANRNAPANERIVEVFDKTTRRGCLISIRRINDGDLLVYVYRCDPGIVVSAERGHLIDPKIDDFNDVVAALRLLIRHDEAADARASLDPSFELQQAKEILSRLDSQPGDQA